MRQRPDLGNILGEALRFSSRLLRYSRQHTWVVPRNPISPNKPLPQAY